MPVIYKFLFPSKPDSTAMSLLLLALRILFGILLMSHGVQKWANFDAMSESFGSVEKYWGCFFCFIVFCIFAL